MSRVALASSGRCTFLRRLTDSSCSTCVLTTPDRSRHNCSTSALARSCFAPADLSCAYIRMFVSTKYLSLMELATRLGWRPLQIQTVTQPRQRTAARPIECLPLPHKSLETIGQQCADRPPLLRRDDAR